MNNEMEITTVVQMLNSEHLTSYVLYSANRFHSNNIGLAILTIYSTIQGRTLAPRQGKARTTLAPQTQHFCVHFFSDYRMKAFHTRHKIYIGIFTV